MFAQLRQRNFFLPALLMLAIFALILRIALWTPLLADDYSYALKGISLQATLTHYEAWSGRIVADFLSSAVLGVRNHIFSATFNTLAFLALLAVVWWLPRFGQRAHTRHGYLTVLVLFWTYWLGNTALGETSFAIVGAANYLWTNVLQCLFIGLFLREAYTPMATSSTRMILITILAVIGGATNENTSLTIFMFISLYAIAITVNRHRLNWRLWLYIAAFAIGMLVLLLAPGNFKRLVHFPEWTTLTFAEQLQRHFLHRIPTAMGRMWPALAMLILLASVRPNLDKNTRWHVAFFAATAFVSLVVFLPLPAMPRRSLNGTLIHILIAISFLLAGWNSQRRFSYRVLHAATASLGVGFIMSYTLIGLSYRDIWRQAAIREQIIAAASAQHATTIAIPDFYYGKLLRPSAERLFSLFSGELTARYYNTPAQIVSFPVQHNYRSSKEALDQFFNR
jgi:hypothetical protein